MHYQDSMPTGEYDVVKDILGSLITVSTPKEG